MTSICSSHFRYACIKGVCDVALAKSTCASSCSSSKRLLCTSSSSSPSPSPASVPPPRPPPRCSKDDQQKALTPNQIFNKIIADEYDGFNQFQSLLKIGQRFKRDPSTWPSDELPFGMTHADFIGKTMHQIELRPERAFANFVPLRLFAFRHLGRMIRARLFHRAFAKYDIFDQRSIIQGTQRAFELVTQSIYKNQLQELIDRNICTEGTVRRFEEVMNEMSERQHNLLNLSQDDIISIAPGVLGPFQNIRQVLRENMVHLTYSILCCALYRKKLLYDAVEKLPVLEPKEMSEDAQIAIPSEYGYAAPRLIFAYLDFSHLLDAKQRRVDPNVNLFDFQFLVM